MDRRQPDYASICGPPKTLAIWLLSGGEVLAFLFFPCFFSWELHIFWTFSVHSPHGKSNNISKRHATLTLAGRKLVGSSQAWFFFFASFALFGALLRPFALFYALSHFWLRGKLMRNLALVERTFQTLGNEKSARSFSDRSFFMDVRAGCPCENACFFQDMESLTEVFGRMSAGISSAKLPLWAEFRAGKKPINKQTHKQNFHGIVPGLSRDCPGTLPAFSWDFLGILFMCFPFSSGKGETHKQFDPHPFPGQSREVVLLFIGFFLPREFSFLKNTTFSSAEHRCQSCFLLCARAHEHDA